MRSINMTFIAGHLGDDPREFPTKEGRTVTRFNVATNRTFSRDGERQDEVTWHRVVAFGQEAEFAAQHLRKGSAVFIRGRIHQDSYTDRESGERKFTVEIVADRVDALGDAPEGRGGDRGGDDRRDRGHRGDDGGYRGDDREAFIVKSLRKLEETWPAGG